MILVEEGKLTLADHADKFIPEFKRLHVYNRNTADQPNSVDPSRPATVKHLLTHTRGLACGSSNDNVATMYRRANYFEVASLEEFIAKVARLPLGSSPGDRNEPSIPIDVLGCLAKVVSCKPFVQFVQAHILDPLKLRDTHFALPEARRAARRGYARETTA